MASTCLPLPHSDWTSRAASLSSSLGYLQVQEHHDLSLTTMTGRSSILLLLVAMRGMVSVEVLDDWALPTVVQKGDKVDLRCNYKLEGENMYSLKWYRDNVGTVTDPSFLF